jgi:hypothetical protein
MLRRPEHGGAVRSDHEVVAWQRHNDGADLKVHALGATLPLALAVERAARLVGVSRSSMYAAVRRGDVETTRLNGRTVVLTVPLLQRMGIDIG